VTEVRCADFQSSMQPWQIVLWNWIHRRFHFKSILPCSLIMRHYFFSASKSSAAMSLRCAIVYNLSWIFLWCPMAALFMTSTHMLGGLLVTRTGNGLPMLGREAYLDLIHVLIRRRVMGLRQVICSFSIASSTAIDLFLVVNLPSTEIIRVSLRSWSIGDPPKGHSC
jgi:hypothetical protein